MRALWAVIVLFGLTLAAQTPATQHPAAPNQPAPTLPDLSVLLSSIEQSAITTASQLQAIRIEKWKTESGQKQQAQQNADSLVRNMQAALPTMVSAARSNPQSFSANFKLYRNLSALYDVLLPLTESAGAFGPKGEYQTLGDQLQRWDEIRRDYGDYLERLAAVRDAAAIAAANQAAAARAKPKKVIVDDTAPPPKKKKKQ